jgi:RHS repeat-associated protein
LLSPLAPRELGAQKPLAITGVAASGNSYNSVDDIEFVVVDLTVHNNSSATLSPHITSFNCKSYVPYYASYADDDGRLLSMDPGPCLSPWNVNNVPAGTNGRISLGLAENDYMHRQDTVVVILNGNSIAPPDTAYIAVDILLETATLVRPPQPTVTPKQTTLSAASWTPRTETFTVANGGNAASTYTLTPDCGSFAANGCSVSPASLTVPAFGSATATVSYRTPAANAQTATIRLTATYPPSLTDAGSIVVTTVNQIPPTLALSPTGTLTSSAHGFSITACDADGTFGTPNVTLNGAHIAPSAYYAITTSGCVTATEADFTHAPLNPGNNSLSAQISDGAHSVTTPWTVRYDEAADVAPTVTAQTPSKHAAGGSYNTDDFVIHNPGPITASYDLSVECDGQNWIIIDCSIPLSSISVGAGQNYVVHASYYTYSLTGTDPLSVTATYRSSAGVVTSGTGTMNVTIDPTSIPEFIPRTLSSTISSHARSEREYMLYNTGTATATYSLSVDCGAWNSCSMPVTSRTLGAGERTQVAVDLTAGNTGSSSTIRVIATAPPSGGVVRADTLTETLTAVDIYPPTATITPDGSGSPIINRDTLIIVDIADNESSIATPTVRLNGTIITARSVINTDVGEFSSERAFYILPFQPGVNEVAASVSDGIHVTTTVADITYDDAHEHHPIIAPVHATSQVAISRTVVDTFLFTNASSSAAAYSIGASCAFGPGDSRTCSATAPTQISVGPSSTVRVPVSYTTGSFVGQTATVTLMATYTGVVSSMMASQQFIATVAPLLPTQITIAPTTGTTLSTATVNLVVNWCDLDDAIAQHTVTWEGQVLPDNGVYSAGGSCFRSIQSTYNALPIDPWAQTVIATATDAAGHVSADTAVITRIADVALQRPAVSPKGGSHSVAASSASTEAFVVSNAGSYAAAYALTPLCRGVANCIASPSVVSLAPGATASVSVNYTAPSVAGERDTVGLVARFTAPTGSAIADTAKRVVVAPVHEVAPVLSAPMSPIPLEPTYVTSGYFSIANPGSEPVTYALHVDAAGGFGFPEWFTPPSSLVVNAGQTDTVVLMAKAPTGDGVAGSLTLTASYTSTGGVTLQGSATATFVTRVPNAHVTVAPKAVTYVAAVGLATTQLGFSATNTGNVGIYGRATLTCDATLSTVVVSCTPDQWSAPIGVDLDLSPGQSATFLIDTQLRNGEPANVRISFDGSSDAIAVHDTGTISVRSSGAFVAVAVSPKGESLSANPNRIVAQRFTITNTGTLAASFDFGGACSGTAITCASVPVGSTGVLLPSQSYSVVDSVTTGAVGLTGTLRLWASSGSVADTGLVSISTGVISDVGVDARGANPGATIDRANCLTIAAGDAAAYECGDLRLVHELPTTTTMNKSWTPTLVYDSRQQFGIALFAANVTVAPGNEPSTLTAHVFVADKPAITRSMTWDPSWSDGRAHRIVIPVDIGASGLNLSTGAYPYRFSVDPIGQSTVAQETDTGVVAIVNRAKSPFGPGWWLDGLEQLVSYTSNQMLWIGGDGSTRLYTQSPTDSATWLVQPALDGLDSLTRDPATNHWMRHLGNGAYAEFDGTLRHVATVDRLGHRTTFTYAGGALTAITIPVPDGSSIAASEHTYTFTRAVDGSGVTQSVAIVAPPIGGTPRVATMDFNSGPGSWTIADPDTTLVRFGLDAQGRVASRTDRRGFTTVFAYDSLGGGTLAESRLDATTPTAVSIIRRFCASEAQGLPASSLSPTDGETPCTAGPVLAADVKSIYDGPRTDSIDVTMFGVNQFGAVTSVTDPYGNITSLDRADAHWPFLVTQVIAPNGHATRATYDATNAHLLASTDVGGITAGVSETTRYVWNPRWDMVERVVPPLGDSTTIGIDPSTGDRLWEQDARGSMSRVTFTYDPATRLVATVTQPGASASDSVVYDAYAGNVEHTTTPRGAVTRHYRDAIGRDTLVSTPTTSASSPPATQSLTYDVSDRVLVARAFGPALSYTLQNGRTADSASIQNLIQVTTNQYDAEGNLFDVQATSQGSSSDAGTHVTSLYDAANRLYEQNNGNGTQTFTLDAAGNAKAVAYTGGGTATTTFDAMNRPVLRIVSAREYGRTTCGEFPDASALLGNGCFMVFPYFPNQADGGTGLHVSGDTVRFVYDVAGNVVRADNRNARIGRSYSPNGLLISETSTIGFVDEPSIDATSSTYLYTYDDDGRRSAMAWQRGVTRYGYTSFGAIDSVTDPLGTVYRVAYDAAARQDSLLVMPAGSTSPGIWEVMSYDVDGNLVHRTRTRAGSITPEILDDSLQYDLRGKLTAVQTSGLNQTAQSLRFGYDGLGAVLARDEMRNDGAFGTEEFRNDALGNVLYSRSRSSAGTNDAPQVSSYATTGGGRLTDRTAVLPSQPTQNQSNDVLKQTFDGGNLATLSHLITPAAVNGPDGVTTLVAEKHYYTGDNRLAVVQRYMQPSVGAPDGTWEEYRYDALGRRVFTRTRRDSSSPVYGANELCVSPNGCESYTERAVWDGDRLQYEERIPENGPADAQNAGSVGYVHLLDLDQPVAVLAASTLVINYDWHGLAESSLHPDGSTADCGIGSDPGCIDVAWPGGGEQTGVYFTPNLLSVSSTATKTWLGTLVANGAGTTGALYRRNRYYSTESGQFTQEDPSGLAGGVNLYGLAGGDPVNFSDPFGLCPAQDDKPCPNIHEKGLEGPGLLDPVALLTGGITAAAEGLFARFAEGAVTDVGSDLAIARAVPNPGGKLGGAAHRATVAAAADAIESEGGTIVAGGGRLAERAIKVGNGRIRFPDIEAFQADGTRVFVNIGKATKAGQPVAREVRALNDLRSTGVETRFIPYNR